MCFSAPASFLTSAGLAAASSKISEQAKKAQKIVVLIPLLFAIQQLIEGMQWLTVKNGDPSYTLGYAYLFFAFLLWPVLIPCMTNKLEKKKKVKEVLMWFVLLGALVSGYLLYVLLTQPLMIEVAQRSILYNIDFPFYVPVGVLYVIAVCGSLMTSSDRKIVNFGVLIFLTALISWIFFQTTFVSVWCFFAAIVSASVYFYVKK